MTPPHASLPPLSDALCARHRQIAIEARWPVPGDFDVLLQSCAACRDHVRGMFPGSDSYDLAVAPNLPVLAAHHEVAIHEAAHAVVAVLTGHYLHSLRMEENLGGRGTSAPAGWITSTAAGVDLPGRLAMLWAGQVASRRWLVETGYDSPAARIDVAYGGWSDTTDAFKITMTHRLPADAGWDLAEHLVAENWTAISEIAEVVMERRDTPGATIRDLVIAIGILGRDGPGAESPKHLDAPSPSA